MEEFPNPPRSENQSLASTSNTSIDDSISLTILRSFPRELINEILLRLPVKSLVKFKCVSRSWHSLISSPQFIKAHINSTNTNHQRLLMWSIFQGHYHLRQCSLNSILYNHASDGVDLEYPTARHDKHVSYVGDYNGLICFCVGSKTLFLWNPAIKKSIRLPSLDVRLDKIYNPYFLVFGLGYNEANDDYVVVCVVCLRGFRNFPPGEAKVYVYSMKSQSWRRIGSFEGGHPWESSRGVFLNGKLHWTLEKKTSGYIIFLDLTIEAYGKIEEPQYEKGPAKLGILDGCLCLLAFKNVDVAEVWVMKEYPVKESWSKLFAIPCNPMRSFISTPLCVSRNGEFLMVLGRELGLYNPERSKFKQMKDFVGMIYTSNLSVESLIVPGAN